MVPKNSIILELMVGLVPPEVDQVPLIEWDGVPPSAPNGFLKEKNEFLVEIKKAYG